MRSRKRKEFLRMAFAHTQGTRYKVRSSDLGNSREQVTDLRSPVRSDREDSRSRPRSARANLMAVVLQQTRVSGLKSAHTTPMKVSCPIAHTF